MALTDCPKCWNAEEHCSCSEKQIGTYKEEFEKLRHICLKIYYARIAMREDLVIKGLDEIDAYFREPNMN